MLNAMNNIKEVRKVGLWVIAGATLATLAVLNVIQETAWLHQVVWVALGALVTWFGAMAVMQRMIFRKSQSGKP